MQVQTSSKPAAIAAALVAGSAGTALASDWNIDPAHTASQFSVKHMMISTVRGQFGKTTGKIHIDDADISKSNIDVTIDATTIDTREPKRDDHLRSADFFDVAKFPTLTFKSTHVQPAGDGYKVTGDLTMHGVTKSVTLDVEALSPATKNPWGKVVRGVSAAAKINRKEWGLGWNAAIEAGGVLVGEEVKLIIDAEMVQAD